jgi:hypothetical protein
MKVQKKIICLNLEVVVQQIPQTTTTNALPKCCNFVFYALKSSSF